jgi:hypothetical protein
MTDAHGDEFVRRAEEVCATQLRGLLEPEHVDEFVAIEPVTWYCHSNRSRIWHCRNRGL